MNMKKSLLISIITLLILSSCDGLLDNYPYGQVDDEEMGKFQQYVSGLVGYAYEEIPRSYRDIEGNRLDCITDDAVWTTANNSIVKFATDAANPADDPFATVWSSSYRAISSLNHFLENDFGLKTNYYLNHEVDEVYKKRLQGEAYGLRAFMEWRLLRFWGGKGIKSGEMLGFPIITEYITADNENTDLKRDTYEACIRQIEEDCNKAYELLPIAHRDFLYDSEYLHSFSQVIGSSCWGRIDGITTRAILADMYLTYASPLFNPGNDMARWQKAATYAKEVIDFKMNKDNVEGGFAPNKKFDWFDPCSPSSIFISRRYNNSNENSDHESDFYPIGFRGKGYLGATQDLVEAFPMENGYPKEHPEGAKLYDPQNPYAHRDPRLYSVIFYPGSQNKHGYTFEAWFDEASNTNGKDAPGLNSVSRTGYHIRKMVFPDLDWSSSNVYKAPHVKHYYRWEHMLLAFAEAANEFEGPNANSFGMSAKDAMKLLRSRQTYDGVSLPYASSDPYLDEAAISRETFRELIKNERRIEFCFEGQRFFDLRRWNTDVSQINKPVHGIYVVKRADATLEYSSMNVEERMFPSLYVPIPYKEILKSTQLEQNEGWNTWSN